MAGDVICYCRNEKSQTVRNEEEMATEGSTSTSSDGSRNSSCGTNTDYHLPEKKDDEDF